MVPDADVSSPSEFLVRSATIVPSSSLIPSTSHGSASTVPGTDSEIVSQSGAPEYGPSLQPHQLFWKSTGSSPLCRTPKVLSTMRLKLGSSTPGPTTSVTEMPTKE